MIHHIFANRSNIGDWLSAVGIQALLTPLEITEHLCDEPFVKDTLRDLRKAGPEDMILIGGGGLLMDYFTPFWEGFREIAGRVPLCVWGVGCVDLKREESKAPKNLLEEIVSRARLCIVRDELSRAYLAGCNLPPPVACPSIVAVERPAQEGWGILHSANYTTAGADVYEVMCDVAKEFASATGRTYRETNNRISADSRQALEFNLSLYARSDVILSSRLHGCIIGLAMGRKVLAVSGDRKVESFMQAAGLSEWVVDIDELASIRPRFMEVQHQRTPANFLKQTRNAHKMIAERVLLVGREMPVQSDELVL